MPGEWEHVAVFVGCELFLTRRLISDKSCFQDQIFHFADRVVPAGVPVVSEEAIPVELLFEMRDLAEKINSREDAATKYIM